jgi:predicted phage terminase large subunit-like protein
VESEQDEIERLMLLERLEGADSLLDFVVRLTPTYMRPDHLRPVADLFARVLRGDRVLACVSIPPRHSKTELSLAAIAWLLCQAPDMRIAYATYQGPLAEEKSRRARDLAIDAGVELRTDSKAVARWTTTAGGGIFAAGYAGGWTGRGANLFIIDDPLKDRAEAESPTIRQKVYDWFTSAMNTRVEPKGSVIVIHTRWHDDDLIGRLAKVRDVKWEIVNLPAVSFEDEEAATPEHPFGPKAVALWPDRWPIEELILKRRISGPYDWASLYRGHPKPKGGRLFGPLPITSRYDLPNVRRARILVVCDPAFTAKTSADHTAIAALAATGYDYTDSRGKLHLDMRVDVLEVSRLQAETPIVLGELRRLAKKWGAAVGVETAAGAKAVPQVLKALAPDLEVFEIPPMGDKLTRALPAAALWQDGRIRVPESEKAHPWVQDFLAELETVTGISDKEDDQMDALAHGVNAIADWVPNPRRVVQEPGPFGARKG